MQLPQRLSPLRAIALLMILVSSVGCAGSSSTVLDRAPLDRVDSDDAVVVLATSDGRYGEKVYEGTGSEVARRVRRALLRKLRYVETVPRMSVAGARQVCLDRGARFLVVPEIHHWEDRATQWSGRLDRVEIDLTLIDLDVDTRRRLRFEAHSAWLTFVNAPTIDLLDEEFEQAVLSLLITSSGSSPTEVPETSATESTEAADEDDSFSISVSD